MLALKKTLLEEEEKRLRTTIDTAIACVRKGEIVMDLATRQGLVRYVLSPLIHPPAYLCLIDSSAS